MFEFAPLFRCIDDEPIVLAVALPFGCRFRSEFWGLAKGALPDFGRGGFFTVVLLKLGFNMLFASLPSGRAFCSCAIFSCDTYRLSVRAGMP